MPDVSVETLVVRLQALETALKHYEFISKSQTVDSEKGNTRIPLQDIIKYDYRER